MKAKRKHLHRPMATKRAMTRFINIPQLTEIKSYRERHIGGDHRAIAVVETAGPFAKVARQAIARIRARTISAMERRSG